MARKILSVIVLFSFPVWILIAGGRSESTTREPTSDTPGSQEQQDNGEGVMELVASGDTAGLEALLKVDVDVNETDAEGRTPLHIASADGKEDIVSLLLLRGAAVDAQDSRGRTALMAAVAGGHRTTIERLVEDGANIYAVDRSGASPVSLAFEGSPSDLAALVTSANVDAGTVAGEPLLHAAAAAGKREHTAFLLETGADPGRRNDGDLLALDMALQRRESLEHARVAALLLENGSPPASEEDWAYLTRPLRSGNLETRFEYGATALHLSCERGHEGMARYLVESGADLGARDQPGNTPLHMAVRRGYRTIAALLLDAGADVNVRDYNDNTPLHESLGLGDQSRLVTLLLDRGADPGAKNGFGNTPLHLTISLQLDADTALLLLDRGAAVDPRNKSGNTPLLEAVIHERREIAELLLSRGANIHARNNRGDTPAQAAIGKGSEVTEWFFVEGRVLVGDNEGREALHLAVILEGDPETMKTLFDVGADPLSRDFLGDTALHAAVRLETLELTSVLLDRGSNLFAENNAGETPLVLAFSKGPDYVVGFLGPRIDITDSAGNTPLFHAVLWERPDIVSALLGRGADPRTSNRQGSTPLHEGVRTGSKEIAAILLNAGADPNAADSLGKTPLHEVVYWGNPDLGHLLVQAGADPDVRDLEGKSPLHEAAFSGDQEMASWLIEAGAWLEIRDESGATPLFDAAFANRLDTTRLLVIRGALITARDNDGNTTLHAALAEGSERTAAFLLGQGADIFAMNARDRTPFDVALASGNETLAWFLDGRTVNIQDNAGNTPLHLAVAANASEAAISLILAKGADRQARNARGETPEKLALRLGYDRAAALVR